MISAFQVDRVTGVSYQHLCMPFFVLPFLHFSPASPSLCPTEINAK
jgi:hypothetical protein